MIPFLIVFSLVLVSELAVALLLTVIPRLGRVGKDIVEACTQAPVIESLAICIKLCLAIFSRKVLI